MGLFDPNEAMLCGRLKNSDSLHNLNVLLRHPAQLLNLIENMVGGGLVIPPLKLLYGMTLRSVTQDPFDNVFIEFILGSVDFLKRKFDICWTMGLRKLQILVGPPIVC